MIYKAKRLGELIQVDNVEKKRGLGHSSTGNPLRGSVANAGDKNEVLRRPERMAPNSERVTRGAGTLLPLKVGGR